MKNQRLSLLAVVSACLLALFGCSPSDSGGSSGGVTLTGPLADVQGDWVTSCYSTGSDYAKEAFTVSGTNITSKADYYSDASCSTSTYRYEGTATNLTIGDSVSFSDGTSGYKITYDVQTFNYTTLSSSFTDLFNTSNFCGITWTMNIPASVLGKNCSGTAIPPKNSTYYNLYNLMGNNLLLGNPETTTYPTGVTGVLYVKQ